MRQAVVLLEEPSARVVTEEIAKRLGISDRLVAIEHQGKSDLESSVARKIIHWRSPLPPRFIIVRDNDGGDCRQLKERLRGLVPEPSRERVKIRLAIHELEGWYQGDLVAVEAAGLIAHGKAEELQPKQKYRDPDRLANAKQEFRRLTNVTGQISIARRVSPHMSLENKKSISFSHFISALRWATEV